MINKPLLAMLAIAVLEAGTAHAGQFDPPDPRIFVRAEDQERARLLMKPCSDADVGRGCYSFNGRASRMAPCTYRTDDTISSLPTDQCYKMEAPRRYRGVWVDEFEGQRFIPEGTSPPEWPSGNLKSAGWAKQAERARLASIWLDASRIDLAKSSRYRGTRRVIEFVGRKTMYPASHGHFGMFGREIIVDRVISLREQGKP